MPPINRVKPARLAFASRPRRSTDRRRSPATGARPRHSWYRWPALTWADEPPAASPPIESAGRRLGYADAPAGRVLAGRRLGSPARHRFRLDQAVPVPRLRSRDPAGYPASGRLAGRCRRWRGAARRAAALAPSVLAGPRSASLALAGRHGFDADLFDQLERTLRVAAAVFHRIVDIGGGRVPGVAHPHRVDQMRVQQRLDDLLLRRAVRLARGQVGAP